MRLAVSGTHCSGKSTLVDEFLLAYPDFSHEPEPYVVLQDLYGEEFPAEPSAEDFHRQLEFNLERLGVYSPSDKVIFERCPVDFLAYLLALDHLRRGDGALIERSVELAKDGIRLLDLIVFLPLNDGDQIEAPDSEDPELRTEVDRRLVGIFNDGDFDIFTSKRPAILEATGSTASRLRILESALELNSP